MITGEKVAHILVGLLLVMGYFASLPGHVDAPLPAFQVPASAQATPAPGDTWNALAASDGITALVHAASMVELPDGRIQAYWFAGSREGARDVGIHSATLDPATGLWSPERRLFDRHDVSRHFGTYIRKLGNAVPVMDPDGRLRLFVVTVSTGGWAASRLVVAESRDLGESWVFTDDLVLSPFLDISYLVKTSAVHFDDGSIGLPVYHEFLGKFGELLRLSADNRVLSRHRIGYGRDAIQPLVLVDEPKSAVVLLRNQREDVAERLMWRSETTDAGQSWTSLVPGKLANAGSAVGGVSLGNGHWLVVGNLNPVDRDELSLAETRDRGEHWLPMATLYDRSGWRRQPLTEQRFRAILADDLAHFGQVDDLPHQVERAVEKKCNKDNCEFQYDYPFLLRARNGDLHLLYTWNKTLIAHSWWKAADVKGVQP